MSWACASYSLDPAPGPATRMKEALALDILILDEDQWLELAAK
jgi:hypothetical protein